MGQACASSYSQLHYSVMDSKEVSLLGQVRWLDSNSAHCVDQASCVQTLEPMLEGEASSKVSSDLHMHVWHICTHAHI